MNRPAPTESLRVTVVGDNVRTIESLREYLAAAGVESRATRSLSESVTGQTNVDALVIFPDEFGTNEVLCTIEALQKKHPKLQLLLVTSAPRSYQGSRLMDVERPPILLPKPAFGWSILDAVRTASSAEGESP
jgi:hypothetical protein